MGPNGNKQICLDIVKHGTDYSVFGLYCDIMNFFLTYIDFYYISTIVPKEEQIHIYGNTVIIVTIEYAISTY